MKKILIFLCLFLLSGIALQAQNEKLRVAVFDPSSSGTSIDEGTKVAVREIISSTLVNTGKYDIVERSLLQQVMKEQEFSNTDVVDESQATELGRLAGANKVVLSVVTLVGGRNMLSIKIIDVKTATVDQQKTRIVSTNDLLDMVEPLTLELLGERSNMTTVIIDKETSKRGNVVSETESRTQVDSKPQATTKPQVTSTPTYSNTNFYVSNFTDCGIEVLSRDLFEEKTTLTNNVCPDGWRLPAREELKCICKNKKKIENLHTGPFSTYFTSESDSKGKVYIRTLDDCEESTENPATEQGWFRCVRSR